MFDRIDGFIEAAEKWIASICLVLTTILAVLQILNRYIVHLEIMGIGDLYVYLYVICLYASFAYATKIDIHTSVDVLQGFLKKKSPRGEHMHGIVIRFLSLAIAIGFLFPAYHFFLGAVEYQEWSTLVPWFNISWLVYAMFLSLCLSVWHMARNLFKAAFGAKRPS